MSRLRISVVLEELELPPREGITAAARLGVSGIAVNAIGPLAPAQLGETARREIRTLLRSQNLDAVGFLCPLRNGLDEPQNLEPRIEAIRRAMQLAVDVGARQVIVPFPKLPPQPEISAPQEMFRAEHLPKVVPAPGIEALREALRNLSNFGDHIGCIISLEAGVDPAPAVLDYLKPLNNGMLQISFDPVNFLLHRHEAMMNLASLRGSISHAFARDISRGTAASGPREVPLGTGDIEWMQYIATLEVVDYHGFLTIRREASPGRPAAIAQAAAFLRRFVGSALSERM
ncbi:MAG: sugar phosphate isomerase/epimerase family protein [Gemmataceae bacterium]